MASTNNQEYILKKQEQLPCNEVEEVMFILFSNHNEEILDSELQRLLSIRHLNPEEEKINGP